MGIRERLERWTAVRRVRPVLESASVAGGREGEELFRELLEASNLTRGARTFAGRRIPSRRQGRRREIDLIVCTGRRVHLVEVKNWSGRLAVVDGHWRQTRRDGRIVDHPDLLETNRLKHEAVLEHLKDRGVPVGDEFARDRIVSRIVFTNPRLDLDPAIEDRPDVFSRRELDAELGRDRESSPARRMLSTIVGLCRESEGGPGRSLIRSLFGLERNDLYRRVVVCLAETETWDQLRLYGGRIVSGDMIALKVGPKVYRKADLASLAGRRPIRLRWARNRAWGLVLALTGLAPPGRLAIGKARWAISPADTLTFHAVGDREPTTLGLAEVEGIALG